MRIYGRSAPRRTRTPLARVLACALLAGIVYSVTFGSAHSHLNVRFGPDVSRSVSAAEQTGFFVAAPLHGNSQRQECLICLFHQQLFNSTVPEPLFVVKPSVRGLVASTPTIFSYSEPIASDPITRLSGRAPPLA